MAKLLIVESPGKLKTLRQILGSGWILEASVGHTTELAHDGARRLGFEIEKDRITTRYVPRGDRGKQVLAKLRHSAQKAEQVYLATDPDREGEAIAWHLVQQLKLKNYVRVSYTQITESAVRKAIQNPGTLNFSLIEAQRARQCLDKLVGYEVSPLLWNSTGGKSAGRVQSSTLHLICERERERLAFRPERYWVLRSIYAEGFEATYEPAPIRARTSEGTSAKPVIEPTQVQSRDEAGLIAEVARTSPHRVESMESKDEFRPPPPPLITSSLQQVAGSRYRYSPKQTMQIAQELYEGVNGKGLITYMRTDAVTLSPEFVAETRDWLQAHAPESLPQKAPIYRIQSDAQAAHEAIRPTAAAFTPDAASKILNRDQLNVYTLIWERAIASQCKPAKLSKAKLTIACSETRWVARGMSVLDPGYLLFWKNTEEQKLLPQVKTQQILGFLDVKIDERVTEPSARYTEPKLVQMMEKRGIGRPSTYASTLATLKEREYALLEKTFMVPTALGMATDEALGRALPDLINPDFTAKMESSLDAIADGKLGWEKYLIDWNRTYLEPAVTSARQILGRTPQSSTNRESTSRKSTSTSRERVSVPGSATVPESDEIRKISDRARKHGPLPICPQGHGELGLQLSRKGGYYWRCRKPGCESFAWFQDFSSRKCPGCGLALEKVPSKKVVGGYFLKCARTALHSAEIVLFKNIQSKQWERSAVSLGRLPQTPPKGIRPASKNGDPTRGD